MIQPNRQRDCVRAPFECLLTSVAQIILAIASLVGVLLASTNFQQAAMTIEQFYGMAILFAAVLSCGLYAVFSRQIVTKNDEDALVVVAGQQMAGLLWIALMVLLAHAGVRTHDSTIFSATIWLLCISTGVLKFLFATGLFFISLRYLSASFASSFLALTPVFGIAAAVSFLGEQLSGSQWLGVFIVLLSVLTIQLADRH
jgi:drug/metabolite transporter (DMT)-like permease